MSDARRKFKSDDLPGDTVELRDEEIAAERPTSASRRNVIIALIAGVVIAASALVFWMTKGTPPSPRSAAQTASVDAAANQVPIVTVTNVVARDAERQLQLPGELQAYRQVAIYPRVQGFVETLNVDRGSVVRRGQVLVQMSAPELGAQSSAAEARARGVEQQQLEVQSRVQSVRAQRSEAEAKLAADEATYNRLKAASAVPGVVAGNDVDVARGAVEAGRARVRSFVESEKAAQAQVGLQAENAKAARAGARSVRGIEAYLRVAAPFDGVVTERNVNLGSLAGPDAGAGAPPMLRLEQISRLRLIVHIPEAEIAGIKIGTPIKFSVPAYPGENFGGTVRRIGRSLDPKTRAMPIELDVINDSARLAPGMFPLVAFPVRRARPSLFVPASAVATTTERTFVVRVRNGVTEWVDVKRGVTIRDSVEVFGDLAENDSVALRGTDELRPDTTVQTKQAPSGS